MKLPIALTVIFLTATSQATIEVIDCKEIDNDTSYTLTMNEESWWRFDSNMEPNEVSCDLNSIQTKMECVEDVYNTHRYTIEFPDRLELLPRFFSSQLQPFYDDGATAGVKRKIDCEIHDQPHMSEFEL